MAHGDTRIIPLELQESLMPFRIEEFSLREDSGGAGKFRGGLGFRKKYRITAPCQSRHQSRPHQISALGRAGRQRGEARPLHARQGRHRRAEQTVDKENAYPLQPGDLVCVETGGGGGYGPPSERALDLIQRDLDAGYVSRRGGGARTTASRSAPTARRGDRPRVVTYAVLCGYDRGNAVPG